MTLTLSVGLHSRRRVDSVSKQTVSGHFQPDHTGTHRTCKTEAKYSHIFTAEETTISGTLDAAVIITTTSHLASVKMFEIVLRNALNDSDNAKYQPTHALLLHVKYLDKNINSAGVS